jgi:hypothetical protein
MGQDAKVSVPKPFNKFEIDFSSFQKLQSIRRKLRLMLSILGGILDVLANLAVHVELVGELIGLSLPACSVLRRELDQISSEIKSHRYTTQSLLGLSDDIRLMVSRRVLAHSTLFILAVLTNP